jgi:citrate lyase subunit beta/citryl-CoA lyase
VSAPRATLVVPADRRKLVEKAAEVDVDAVLLDLEDAVAPESKASARAGLEAAIAHLGAKQVGVRVNALDTPWGRDDLRAVASLPTRPAAVVIPKAEDPAAIRECDRILNASQADPLALHALVETARGVTRLVEIANATEALSALVLGYADLAASLGRPEASTSAFEYWAPIQDALVIAARAAGLSPIDGPLLNLDDRELLERACETARLRGFDGKWAIHPAQVATITRWFTPDADEVAHARAILDALDAAQARGDGSARLGSVMIDEALRKSALATLARAGDVP